MSKRKINHRAFPQTPQSAESQRQIDALIEHKCKQMSKANSGSKGSAIHLEQWMKGQLGSAQIVSPDDEPEPEVWSEEMLKRRSEELQIGDLQSANIDIKRNESRCEEITLSDQEQSPSRSTTTESQVKTIVNNYLFVRFHS